MALFSERYNYTKPTDMIIRESFPTEIANGVCTCLDKLNDVLEQNPYIGLSYTEIEQFLWISFLNKRLYDFYGSSQVVATKYMLNCSVEWFKKLDMLEYIIKYLFEEAKTKNRMLKIVELFVKDINYFFSRLHYAYKVVGSEIVEITSEIEVETIEKSLEQAEDNIREHLACALKLYAKKPKGDYRNSIKESISAVEAYCREKTGENTLGAALNKMEAKGLVLPKILKVAFDKLYAYTNQPNTGIRHALMGEEDGYAPNQEEALFMLVSCCSFLNYLKKKEK